MDKISSIQPGEILKEEFMKPKGLSAANLAEKTGISIKLINQIVKGEEKISLNTAQRLAECFGNSPEFWSGIQTEYDLREKFSIAFHFVRLAWLDFYNLAEIHKRGYNLGFFYIEKFNKDQIHLSSISVSLPPPNLVLAVQLVISTLEKLLKSIRAYRGLPVLKTHSLEHLLKDLDLKEKYLHPNGSKFSFSIIPGQFSDLWNILLKLDYTMLRYESGADEFEISIQYQDFGNFIQSIRLFLQLWSDFLSSECNHTLDYPKDIILSGVKWEPVTAKITLTNKIKGHS